MRAKNRPALVPMLADVLKTRKVAEWYAGFDAAGVPSGPINGFAEVFADPQIVHRQMLLSLPHASAGSGAAGRESGEVLGDADRVSSRAARCWASTPPRCCATCLVLDEAGIAELQRNKVV